MSPQSPGASSVVKVRKSAPLQQGPPPPIVDEVVELVDVEVVAPGAVVEVVVGPGTLDVVVGDTSPGQTTGAGALVAMKRPVSLRRTVPPNCAQ
jgi:hypothetical protein